MNRSPLVAKEDYWAIWIGAFLLIVGLLFFYFIPGDHIKEEVQELRNKLDAESNEIPFKTVEWYETQDQLSSISSSKSYYGEKINDLLRHPVKWVDNPVSAFWLSDEQAKSMSTQWSEEIAAQKDSLSRLRSYALQLQQEAKDKNYTDDNLNSQAKGAIQNWLSYKKQYSAAQKKANVSSYNIIGTLVLLSVILAILFGIGMHLMGISIRRFIQAFLMVFLIAVLAHLLGNQADMKNLGFGYAIWAIAIGLLISNTLGTPEWIKPGVQTEYYIKTGLVLLGAEILFGKILAIGLPGIFIAWIVTPFVLLTTYWFGQRVLKIASKSLNITISADMSVCGVSAAIATAAACKAKKEELTLAVGLSMVFTSIMMVALPAFIKAVNMPEVLGGAWIGGTVDATGAVVAAGAFLGERALNVAATIKMIQNMLIGLIAFFVAFYWATKVEKSGKSKVGAGEIWYRFPKFILGFVGASIVFSLIYASVSPDVGNALIDKGVIGGFSKELRGWFFSLAFVSIGLSVNFKELRHNFKGGKPLILYITGQTLNIILTLLIAYLMFYIIFPEITAQI